MREENEEIDLKETKKQAMEAIKYIKGKLKDPKFYIDNAILIALIIIVIYLATKGKFIDKQIIEMCNGVITP